MVWKQKQSMFKYDKYDDIQTKLGAIMGINDLEEWLTPSAKSLYSPYLLENIDMLAERIIKAIKTKEVIGVFCDHDCDGITSGVMMIRYLTKFTDVSILYNQRSNGHGLENLSKDLIYDEKITCLIVVDSSTNSVIPCQELKENGVDVLIIDHHIQEVDNPYAIIVNNQTSPLYPNKELSGAGMVYKVMQVVDEKLQVEYADEFLDLVGLGIYGDMMSMREPENRYLVYSSLKGIKNDGLKALLKEGGVFDADSQAYGYNIVPLVNASARMDNIELIIELLTTDDEQECKKLAKSISNMNKLRKLEQKDKLESMDCCIDHSHKAIIAIAQESTKGFSGLIANNLMDKYKKPCLVVELDDNGIYFGSARSYNGFPLRSFLEKSGLFLLCQGHEGAHGVRFKAEDLDNIHNYIDQNLKVKSDSTSTLYYDIEIEADQIDRKFIEKVKEFNFITGKGVPTTKFLIKNFTPWEMFVMGDNKNVVKLKGDDLEAIKFNVSSDWGEEALFKPINVLGSLKLNKYYHRGLKTVIVTNQILVDDMEV